jgi:hypothetical protein
MDFGWRGDDRARPADGAARRAPTSNTAFDNYRAETLRRLEREQGEFQDFLDRLRAAKDQSEFDQFMALRRTRADAPPVPSQG